MNEEQTDGQSRFRGINLKKIQWHAQPQIISVPQIASSVSSLASKVLRKRGECSSSEGYSSKDTENEVENPDVKFERPPRAPAIRPRIISRTSIENQTADEGGKYQEPTDESHQPSKLVGKVFAKLHIGRIRNLSRDKDLSSRQNGCDDTSVSREASSEATTTSCGCIGANQDGENASNSAAFQERQIYRHPKVVFNATEDFSPVALSRECGKCSKEGLKDSRKLLRSSLQQVNPNVKNLRMLETEDAQKDAHQLPNSHESPSTSNGSLSSKGDNDYLIVDCEIHWEDIQLREEIGQGSCAVVHHGIWNGSDVTVKIYSGNEYNEETLAGYKKEIDIMRRLRHPNVLLFMGAVYSHEKLAVVTEFLPRGSLFRTLHRNNHLLDIRRRLRMALDVVCVLLKIKFAHACIPFHGNILL